MENKELAEIRKRVDMATEGPWEVYKYTKTDVITEEKLIAIGGVGKDDENNARFIANARQDIPKLLAEFDRMRSEIEVMRNTFRNIDALIDEHRLAKSRSADGLADEVIELISELERKVGELT